MANVAQQWGRRALDFVDAVERLPSPGTSLSDLTAANGRPPEWFELYTRENFSVVDPTPQYGASTLQPFEWSGAHYDKEGHPAVHLVMTRAASSG